VTVKINTGGTAGSRALTDELAKSSANYMEVIFKGSDRYYRAEGLLTQTLSIRIPAIQYTVNNAILLIGKKTSSGGTDDYALLAIGTTTDKVTTSTSKIDFTIKSLKADLCAEGSPTFNIEEYSGKDASDNDYKIAEANDRIFENETKKGTFTDEFTPCFQVPLNTFKIYAALTITDFVGNSTTIKVIDVTSTDPKVKFDKITGSDTLSADDINVVLSTDTCVISFLFDSKTAGSYIITFDIPVVGFVEYVDDTTTLGLKNAKTWYIRGGTISSPSASPQPLTGSGETGVALAVTAEPFQMTDTIVGPIKTDDTNWD